MRTKEERKEYGQELLRPATKREVLQLFCFACALLALALTIQNVVRATVQIINGVSVPWERVSIIQAMAIFFYLVYVYLKRYINRIENKGT